MYFPTTKCLYGIFVITLLHGLGSNKANAQANFYMITLENKSGTTINYHVQWGTGVTRSYWLAPGRSFNHWIPNRNIVPMYVTFDWIGGDGRSTPTRYRLYGYGGWNFGQSKRHQFYNIGNAIYIRYVN